MCKQRPSEANAWLIANGIRDAAKIVVEFSIDKDRPAESVGQTVVLALVVTLQMQPGSMTDQAVRQQVLQLSIRRL